MTAIAVSIEFTAYHLSQVPQAVTTTPVWRDLLQSDFRLRQCTPNLLCCSVRDSTRPAVDLHVFWSPCNGHCRSPYHPTSRRS